MLAIVLLAMSASALAFAVSARAPVAALAIVGTSAVIILQVVCSVLCTYAHVIHMSPSR